MIALLRDNPIMDQQWRRLRRMGLLWSVALVAAWCALAYVLRYLPVVQAPTLPNWRLGMALLLLPVVVRVEIPVLMMLVVALVPRREWLERRDHLATSLLVPRQLVVGLATVPIIVLIVANTATAVVVYASVWNDVDAWPYFSRTVGLLFSAIVWTAGLTEDVLWLAMAALLVIRHRLDPAREGRLEGGVLLLQLLGLGAVLAILFSLGNFVYVMITATLQLPDAVAYALTVGVIQLLIFGFEALMIRQLWKSALNKAEAWLAAE